METRGDERMKGPMELKRVFKGFAISIGIALVFYVFNFPRLKSPHEHLKYFLLCFMYGIVIFFTIWIFHWIQWLVTGKPANDRPYKIPVTTQSFLSLAGTILGLYLAEHLDAWLSDEEFTYSQFWQSIFFSAFIALMFQFYYAWKQSQQENLQLKAAKAEAELHVLRNQMQPHFLFNSLNSLAALIDSDPATAGDATQKLADLYRLILDCSKNPLSPLEREVQISRLYLEIEKIRFGRRLNYLMPTLTPGERNLLVPSLVIQTLVENAVKHGIAGSVEGGFVHLTVRRESAGLRVEVVNSGSPLAAAPRSGGTGVRNTEERLGLLFGAAHGFQLARNPDGLTSATFLIPEKT